MIVVNFNIFFNIVNYFVICSFIYNRVSKAWFTAYAYFIWLNSKYKYPMVMDIDFIICAKLLDKNIDPIRYESAINHHVS